MAENVSIRMDGLSKTFPKDDGEVEAVKALSLEVSRGEIVCLVGPSGCGKTTILRLIAGLEKPTSGSVYEDGVEIEEVNEDCGFVFQEYALFPWRTVLKNIEFGLEIKGMGKEERRRIAQEHIELMGLNGFENAYPHELSGGMKQRVGIARAMATGTSLLLMDEPFGSLDAQTRNIMQNELLKVWEKTKKTIIFVTHSVDESVYLADRIAVLTARPATVKKVIDVKMDRPRERASPEFAKIRKEILAELEEEVKRAMREQRGRR